MNHFALRMFVRSLITEAKEDKEKKEPKKAIKKEEKTPKPLTKKIYIKVII